MDILDFTIVPSVYNPIPPELVRKPWESRTYGRKYGRGKSTKYTKNIGKKKRINRKHRRN